MPDKVNVDVLKVNEQFIHCGSKDQQHLVYYSVVYGLHRVEDRLPLWRDLRQVYCGQSPWLCAGYFNAVKSSEELMGTLFQMWKLEIFFSLCWWRSRVK